MVTKDTEFLTEIIRWADGRPDISALVMTGSRAQRDGTVDDLSDYDLEIFTSDPESYTSSDAWMSDIASVWVYLPTTRNGLCETRLIIFEGGIKVDFSIRAVELLQDMVRFQRADELYDRGYRVLIDKKGLASQLPPSSYKSSVRRLPTEAEFEAAIEEFWFEASHIPKYLQRDDLWVVKFRDWTMKERLLQMLEWRGSAANRDVRHIGMRMKNWIPPAEWRRIDEVLDDSMPPIAGGHYWQPYRSFEKSLGKLQTNWGMRTLQTSMRRLVATLSDFETRHSLTDRRVLRQIAPIRVAPAIGPRRSRASHRRCSRDSLKANRTGPAIRRRPLHSTKRHPIRREAAGR